MGDFKSPISELEGEENLIAAAKQIVKALSSKKKLTADAKKILVELGNQLSNITISNEMENEEEVDDIEERLNNVQEKILNWEADQSMIWESGQHEAFEYLNAADDARKLTEMLETACLNKDDKEYDQFRRSHDVLQTAMARLEEEFKHMLSQNKQPFEPEPMSFRSSEDDSMEVGSIISFGEDLVEDSIQRDSVSRGSEEFIIDLVHPDVIPELKSIANLMFVSKYDQECIQAYLSVRRDAMDECLLILEMERLSIEDVLKLEWGILNSKIKRWIRAMKVFTRVYLASEKTLCDQIFGEQGSVSLSCFVEASKGSVLQLLNFGEAMSIGPHSPEKLSRILDMFEVLDELLPDIDELYLDEVGLPVRTEYHEVLKRLGESSRTTFLEFEKAVQFNTSPNAFAGGGVHPLTKYVMNYLLILTDYGDTLNLLLKDHDSEDLDSISPDTSPTKGGENNDGSSLSEKSPMACHFRKVASILESNIDDKSKLYKDTALQHFFLMNNIRYVAQKVKGCELRVLFGDGWIRKHNWKYQHHARNYERASWSLILSLLKDEGIQNTGSSMSKILKGRLRSFYLGFEEIYKIQTAWVIPDPQLREELRISTSSNVIQAYRSFVGRHHNHINDRDIKYIADDLENYILDLFEGSPKSLPSGNRR